MINKISNFLSLFLLVLFSCNSGNLIGQKNSKKIAPPETGIYAGAFPDMGSTEDSVTYERLVAFENLTGQKPVWVYFSNNWFGGIKFPLKEVTIIKQYGSVPFIRMMMRSDFSDAKSERVYSLQKIIEGKLDKALKKWADDAKSFGEPLMVEFGTEVNGDWFSWSGINNGRNPEIFKEAYIHIIELFRDEEVNNITWVYHVHGESAPDESWNSMSAYYPGDDYIDWLGMSIYGVQEKGETLRDVNVLFDDAYKKLSAVSKNKPLALLEFGMIEHERKAEWLKSVFDLLKSGKYNRIKAISYWHSLWDNGDGSVTNMRLDSSPEPLKVYKEEIADKIFQTKIVFQKNSK